MLDMRFIANWVVFFALSTFAFAQPPRPHVSVDEAKDLVLAALPAKTKHLRTIRVSRTINGDIGTHDCPTSGGLALTICNKVNVYQKAIFSERIPL